MFSAPWIDGKPYHEAQQFANCGLHTLNNLLMRMSNGDTSLLVTRPMLERYIKKAFDEAFARRGFLEGQDPDEIYDRELNDRFKEYFLDDLSGYGGAHADQGFLPFGMQEGSFQSSGLLLQDQDEIDQCEAIGVAFQFAP